MRRAWLLSSIVLAVAAACGSKIGFTGEEPAPENDASVARQDATAMEPLDVGTTPPPDMPDARGPDGLCDPRAPFTTPKAISELDVGVLTEGRPTLSADERDIYFHRATDTTNAVYRVYHAARDGDGGAFGATDEMFPTFTMGKVVVGPTLSPDGMTFFVSAANVGEDLNLYEAKRKALDAGFTSPIELTSISGGASENPPFAAASGRLFYQSNRIVKDGGGLYMSTPDDAGNYQTNAELKDGADASFVGGSPVVDPTEQFLYFATRNETGKFVIMVGDLDPTGRIVTNPTKLDLPSPYNDGTYDATPGWLSPDRCHLYFQSNAVSVYKLYVATR